MNQRSRLSISPISHSLLHFYLHLYIYLSDLIRNIYLTDFLSLSYISTDILLEEPDITSVEASVDLIKLYIVFDNIMLPNINIRKCMIETRSNITGKYKGLILSSSIEDAEIIKANIEEILNKNINTNNFNAVLTLLILFSIIKALPPSLSWMILDANISGDSKDVCTGSGACWTYIKIWLRRFVYGMYPNDLQWRINISFILLIALAFVGYFATEKLKKFLTLYYVVIYPIIAFILIYYLISGGAFGLEWVETGAWGGLSLSLIHI
mgnify:CR=1 FL=1